MRPQGVPIAVIAAWTGHEEAARTARLYAHSQDETLKVAATAVTTCDSERDRQHATPLHMGICAGQTSQADVVQWQNISFPS
jgi:hypothetical protein